MRVLAIGAHPDDIEILCAGTLYRYRQQGATVVVAHACTGDKGHLTVAPAELARIRGAEAHAAAELLGAEYLSLGMPDGELYDTPETRLRLVDLMRAARPDLIITHSPNDYHLDHIAISHLVTACSFLIGIPHMKTEHPPHRTLPPVFFMDNVVGIDFQPTEYVDIGEDGLAMKLAMMRSHASQMTWLADHDGIDPCEQIQTVARFRGFQAGVRYAEGFRPHQAWGRIRTQRLLP